MSSPKVILNIPTCFQPQYLSEVQEGLDTWVPLIKYPVIYSVSNSSLNQEYILVGNQLHCNCTDELDLNFSLKRFYFIKWAIETQEFDYLYLTGSDTFVHPYRFRQAIKDYFINKPYVDYIGEIYPRDGSSWNYDVITQHFIEHWRIFNPSQFPNWPDSDMELFPYACGGVGYILSKKAAQVIVDNFDYLISYSLSLPHSWCDDVIISQVLRNKANIILYHDNRFDHWNPEKFNSGDSFPNAPSWIEESNFTIAQHNRSLKFKEIMEKLNL